MNAVHRGSATDPAPLLRGGQLARRQRVIDAALALASEGGYEAVQMRDVATRAGVALGTIYRYFSSKDHLLAAAFTDWAGGLEQRIMQRPSKATATPDRVVDILRRATRAVSGEPVLFAALVCAISSSEAGVAECQRDVQAVFARLITAAMPDVDAAKRPGIIRTLGQVWFTGLLGWVNGWPNAGDMGDDLEETARLLLER